MAMKKGEKYECSNSDCGCEISVTRGSEASNTGRSPRCCCGEEMMPKEDMKRASAGAGGSHDRQEFSR